MGYWARVDSGQHPKKTPLPNNKDPELETISFIIPDEDEIERQLQSTYQVDPKLLDKARQFKTSKSINKHHSVIATTRKGKTSRLDNYGRVNFDWTTPDLGLKVTPQTYERACRFLESIVRLLEDVGWKYTKRKLGEYSKRDYDAVITDGISDLHVELKEPVKQVENRPEKWDRSNWWHNRYEYIPTGLLQFSIHGPAGNFKTTWKDTASSVIEDHFVEIVESFAKSFEYSRLLKIKREEERLEQEREERLRQDQLRLEKIEEERRELLISMAERHDQAESIRRLIASLSIYKEGDKELREWLSWSQGVVEMLDPVSDIRELLNTHDQLGKGTHQPHHLW